MNETQGPADAKQNTRMQEFAADCRNCGAPLAFALDRGHFVCEYCGSLHFPGEPNDGVLDLGIRSTVECPVCSVPLVHGYSGRTPVLYCVRCKGLLVSQAAFVLAVQLLRASATDPPIVPPPMNRDHLRRRIGCPQCGRTMDTHPYGGPGNIAIDNCPRCHVNWLDYREFQRIVDAPGRDRRHPR